MSQSGRDISSLYMDDGYLFFRADPIETAVYNDTIDHEIRIVEGPQATIKNVTISGNDKTKEWSLLLCMIINHHNADHLLYKYPRSQRVLNLTAYAAMRGTSF